MSHNTSTQAEVGVLSGEYEAFIRKLRAEWIVKNRSHSRDVYEVMSPRDREEVHNVIDRWQRYVTPLAEAWWKERGYGVTWPDDNSQPMQVFKLENQDA